MVIFDVGTSTATAVGPTGSGVRIVWQIDLPDICGTHLHPADVRGAIVSLDDSMPSASWHWGGPTGRVAPAAPRQAALDGVAVDVADPSAVARRWAEVLAVPVEQEPAPASSSTAHGCAFRPWRRGRRKASSRSPCSCPPGFGPAVNRSPSAGPGSCSPTSRGSARGHRLACTDDPGDREAVHV